MSKAVPTSIPRRSPLKIQILVIRTLFLREVASRFGKYQLGLFWMIIQPLMGVLVVGIFLGPFLGRSVPEIPYMFFLLNGVLLLKLFTTTMNAGLKTATLDQGLLIYRNVKPVDPILARFFYNLLTTLFALVVFCVGAIWLGVNLSLGSLHILFAAYLITWLGGCGIGLILGIAHPRFNALDKIIKFFQRPLFIFSAVLIPTNALPTATRELFMYNPLVHTIELSRNALFPMYPIIGPNLLYPSAFVLVLLAIGITYFYNNRNNLDQL